MSKRYYKWRYFRKKKKNNSIEKEILENRINQEYENIEVINANINKKSFSKRFENIKVKYKKDPKKFIILASSFLLLLSLVFGTSYAALTYLTKTGKTTKIESGTLALKLKNESNTINLSGALPQEDKDGLEQNYEYEFTVENTGSIPANYKVILENECDLNQKYEINGEEKTPDKCIPNEYIKVGLKKGENDYKVLEYDKEKNEYIIETGLLKENESESYKMKIWLDYDTPNDYNPQNIYTIIYAGKLNIQYEQTTANYNENTYTVKYHANGGNGTMNDEIFAYNEEKSLSKNNFTKEGETFLGWSTDGTDKIIYSDEETVEKLTDEDKGVVILYAVWGKEVKTVNITIENGTATDNEKNTTYGGSASFTLRPNTGYSNSIVTCTNGEKTSMSGNILTVYDIKENTQCTVAYEASTYTIKYVMNGAESKNSETVKYDVIKNIQNPTKTFYINIINNASVDLSATTISKKQTFAGWTSNLGNGLDSTVKVGTTSSPETSWDGSLTKATYFKNLNSNAGTVTLTANWTPVSLTLPTIEKTGYICGFATTPEPDSITYASGTSYKPSEVTGSVTLYTVCELKTKKITYTITYDTSKYPGPSSTYKTDTYQTLSKENSVLSYGSSETITASPAYPDDRYAGSVSCTNGITATLTTGSGTTSRTDSIKTTNNSDTTTASVCTIKYTPKWKGVAAGTYTSGTTFASSNYSNNSNNWTIVSDNGDNIGLAYNDVLTTGWGKYEDASTFLEDAFSGNSVMDNDIAKGGIKKQTNGYITTDSGTSKGLTAYNYWISKDEFYFAYERDKYKITSNLDVVYGSANTRGTDNYNPYATTITGNSIATVKTLNTGIKKIDENKDDFIVENGQLTMYNVQYSEDYTSSYSSTRMVRFVLGYSCDSKSSTSLCYRYKSYNYANGTYTLRDYTDVEYVARAHSYICGGEHHGDTVVYRYRNNSTFYYGNEAFGTGWQGDTWSVENAVISEYLDDAGKYWYGSYAGYATTCGDSEDSAANCEYTTVDGLSRTIRKYRFDTYGLHTTGAHCAKRLKYTIRNQTVYMYYRPYIVVRER